MCESFNHSLINKCINILKKQFINMNPKSKVLIIAGSDSSGGAGIQADIKTVTSLRMLCNDSYYSCYCSKYYWSKINYTNKPKEISNQIEFTSKDIKPNAIKIGMLHSKQVIQLYKIFKKIKIKKVVLDPVMVAKGGAKLINNEAIIDIKNKLIKNILLITQIFQKQKF